MNLTAVLSASASVAATVSAANATSAGKQSGETAVTAAKNAAASPLGAIQKRVQADADSTKTQLSAFGVLKSAVAQSQSAGQAAGKLSSSSSAADITKAMGDLFNGYNGAVSASQKAAQSTAGNPIDAGNAGRVSRDYARTLSGPATADSLKKLGLSVKADGGLVQDARKFAEALKADPAGVRDAIVKLGTALNSTATKELEQSGAVGGALSRLSQRSTALAAQQKALSSAAQSLAAYKANS